MSTEIASAPPAAYALASAAGSGMSASSPLLGRAALDLRDHGQARRPEGGHRVLGRRQRLDRARRARPPGGPPRARRGPRVRRRRCRRARTCGDLSGRFVDDSGASNRCVHKALTRAMWKGLRHRMPRPTTGRALSGRTGRGTMSNDYSATRRAAGIGRPPDGEPTGDPNQPPATPPPPPPPAAAVEPAVRPAEPPSNPQSPATPTASRRLPGPGPVLRPAARPTRHRRRARPVATARPQVRRSGRRWRSSPWCTGIIAVIPCCWSLPVFAHRGAVVTGFIGKQADRRVPGPDPGPRDGARRHHPRRRRDRDRASSTGSSSLPGSSTTSATTSTTS